MKAINRYTDFDGGGYRIFSNSNPQYYKDGDGNFNAIDIFHSSSNSNSNINSYTLFEKNINSIGIRTDNNPLKYVGIRPDENQSVGSHQVEWSIEDININNTNIPIELNTFDKGDNNFVNLGNVYVHPTRHYVRQMVYYTSSINDFKIKYKLNLKGFKLRNKKYSESTIIRNPISCSLIDCGDIAGGDYVSKINLHTNDDSVLCSYITNDTLIVNPNFDPHPYYAKMEMSSSEFTTDVSSYSIINRDTSIFWNGDDNSSDDMSSIYVKDNMMLRFKNNLLADRVKNNILELLNAYLDGNYIRIKGGKKVGSYVYLENKSVTYLTLVLKDITHISNLFRYKSFDDFSYVTNTYSDIINSIKTCIGGLEYPSITSSVDYFLPDYNRNNSFTIVDNDDKYFYSIKLPVLLNSELHTINTDTIHTLKDIGDDCYEYIKYPNEKSLMCGITSSVNYIDANTVYAGAGDGYIYKSATSWHSSHNSTTGTALDAGSQAYYMRNASSIPLKGSSAHSIRRSFFNYDTSEIDFNIADVSWRVYNYEPGHYTSPFGKLYGSGHILNSGTSSMYFELQKSFNTEDDSLSNTNFRNFTSSISYLEPDQNIMKHSDYKNSGRSEVEWHHSGSLYVSYSLNDTAKSAIKDNDKFGFCIRGWADYVDEPPMTSLGTRAAAGWGYFTDQTGTDKDPYLYIIEEPPNPINLHIKSGRNVFRGGKHIIR